MLEKAFLLTADSSSSDDERAGRLLEFFGVPFETCDVKDFVSWLSSVGDDGYRIMCSANTFASAIRELQSLENRTGIAQQIHSVFLYSNGDVSGAAKLITQIFGPKVSVAKPAGHDIDWQIADDGDGMFGAMRGLHVRPAAATLTHSSFFVVDENSVSALIKAARQVAFLRVNWRGVPVFIASERLIDINAELKTSNFDIRDHFFSAVPFVSYVRWAFEQSSWNAPEPSACLVIDDPLLKTRYGFLRFRELLALMKRAGFSTSIAFIPWNWRRSDPKIVKLFKDNRENYSLCIHGCDHTGGEFGISNQQQLRGIAREAISRMSLHEERTGLAHDRVMVFPQGIFSEQAIAELKHAGFNAVVNTEVHSTPSGTQQLKISDVWDVAVMNYATFPVYTRRYPAQGIENLAFDLLLGKPCLIVVHHDFFSNGYASLAEFIIKLNALKVSLTWRSLGEVVRRGYRQKKRYFESVEIEMYGSELLVENRSNRPMNYHVRRRERETHSIENISADSDRLQWNSNGDYVEFTVDVAAGASTLLKIDFKPVNGVMHWRHDLIHSLKTVARRYLSEVRDNYVMPAKARMAAFSRS